MYSAYKSKSTKRKSISRPNRRESVKRNSGIQAFDDVRIFYKTPCNDSNDCIGTVRIEGKTYNGDFCEVTQKEREDIMNAICRAKAKLKKALSDSLLNGYECIKKAISEVLDVFEKKPLIIYPLKSDDTLGKAAKEDYKISINIEKLHGKIVILTKTLIHEAFHIIGGCTGDNDIPCDNGMSKRDAFAEIKDCSIADMNADVFAQFVMKC